MNSKNSFFDVAHFKSSAKVVDVDQYQIFVDHDMGYLDVPPKSIRSFKHQISSNSQSILIHLQAASSLVLHIDDAEQSFDVTYHIVLEKDVQLVCTLGLLQSSNLNIAIYVYLQAEHARADISGVYAMADNQIGKIKTYQMHYAANTYSSFVLKGMLKDAAQADIQGLIYIDEFAYRADALQENKNILIGKHARVVSVPSIEVLQHDVQCCHGTAVGQFDEKHLWYLQSRGVSVQRAHELLITSFFGSIVGKFKYEAEFMEMICKKMI